MFNYTFVPNGPLLCFVYSYCFCGILCILFVILLLFFFENYWRHLIILLNFINGGSRLILLIFDSLVIWLLLAISDIRSIRNTHTNCQFMKLFMRKWVLLFYVLLWALILAVFTFQKKKKFGEINLLMTSSRYRCCYFLLLCCYLCSIKMPDK